jgi:hypothetical protein
MYYHHYHHHYLLFRFILYTHFFSNTIYWSIPSRSKVLLTNYSPGAPTLPTYRCIRTLKLRLCAGRCSRICWCVGILWQRSLFQWISIWFWRQTWSIQGTLQTLSQYFKIILCKFQKKKFINGHSDNSTCDI